MRRKGGIRSGEVRREKKCLRRDAQIIMEVLDELGREKAKYQSAYRLSKIFVRHDKFF